jgi:hypothetical protein
MQTENAKVFSLSLLHLGGHKTFGVDITFYARKVFKDICFFVAVLGGHWSV